MTTAGSHSPSYDHYAVQWISLTIIVLGLDRLERFDGIPWTIDTIAEFDKASKKAHGRRI